MHPERLRLLTARRNFVVTPLSVTTIVPICAEKREIGMTQGPSTIAPEVIDCIAEGRDPSVDELFRVAGQIWTDIRGPRSAFAWGELTHDSSERLLSLRAAQAALAGNK